MTDVTRLSKYRGFDTNKFWAFLPIGSAVRSEVSCNWLCFFSSQRQKHAQGIAKFVIFQNIRKFASQEHEDIYWSNEFWHAQIYTSLRHCSDREKNLNIPPCPCGSHDLSLDRDTFCFQRTWMQLSEADAGGSNELSHFINTHFRWRSCYIHQFPTFYPPEESGNANANTTKEEWKKVVIFVEPHSSALLCLTSAQSFKTRWSQQIYWWVMLFAFVLLLFAAISCSVFKAKPLDDSYEKTRKPPSSGKFGTAAKKRFSSLHKHSPWTPASWPRAFQIMSSYPEWRKAASPRSERSARSLFHKDERPPEGS